MEVMSDDKSQPHIMFSGKARQYAEHLSVRKSYISISHDSGSAVAVVVLER